MRCNEMNRYELREFLIKVRTSHGLGIVEFARLIGLKYSIWQQIEDETKKIGGGSLKKIAESLSLSRDVVSAILDPEAQLVKFPPPESITLEKPQVEGREMLIGPETLHEMMAIVSAAGHPLPLSTILQRLH